ncbi:MAG TPA: cytochrome P450, partial [Thermomicrobiales bacterium]|nr:cytochrome P450 [Thermomicrobiales bacterium]
MDEQTALAPFLPGFKADAFPFYERLREAVPVVRTTMPDGQPMWLVSRYETALAVLRDAQRFGNDPQNAMTPAAYEAVMEAGLQALTPEQREQFAEVDAALNRDLLGVDPPDHTRLRKLVAQSFTPRFIEGLRSRVQQIADDLLDKIEARADMTGEREIDLIDAFAFPLPITVISEMLGVPHEDRERFRVWSNAVVQFNPAEPLDSERMRLLREFTDYLRGFVARKREEPGDDLVSGLIAAEEAGDNLSEDELISMMFLLIVAGHETTVNLIGNGMLALFEHPAQLRALQADPSLVKGAIEEFLRYVGPVEMSLTRFAREDVEIDGQTIRRGDQVTVMLASANHDPAQFPEPERFDIGREP